MHRLHAPRLGLELPDVLADGGELGGQAVGLGVDVRDAPARFLECMKARLHVGERPAEVEDPLAHGVQPLVLQLEPLDRALHVVAQRGQAAPQFLVGLLDLLVVRADLLGLREHVRVNRLELVEPALQGAQTLGALFMLADLPVDLAHQVVEPGRLAGGAVDRLALLLQGRHLLAHVVGERLERAELPLGLCRVARDLGQLGHRLLQGAGARLGGGDATLDLLLPRFERAEPRGGSLGSAAQLLLTLAHPVEPLRDVTQLRAEAVGVHAECLEAAAQLEEACEIVLEGEGLLQRAPHLFDLGAQPLGVFRRVGQLGLRAPLHLGDGFGLLVERGQHRHEPLERLDARLQLAQHPLGLGDRLRELGEALPGLARRVRERFEGDALPLHLRQNGAKLGGQLLRRRLVTEKLPGSHMRFSRRRGARTDWRRSLVRALAILLGLGRGSHCPVLAHGVSAGASCRNRCAGRGGMALARPAPWVTHERRGASLLPDYLVSRVALHIPSV